MAKKEAKEKQAADGVSGADKLAGVAKESMQYFPKEESCFVSADGTVFLGSNEAHAAKRYAAEKGKELYEYTVATGELKLVTVNKA